MAWQAAKDITISLLQIFTRVIGKMMVVGLAAAKRRRNTEFLAERSLAVGHGERL